MYIQYGSKHIRSWPFFKPSNISTQFRWVLFMFIRPQTTDLLFSLRRSFPFSINCILRHVFRIVLIVSGYGRNLKKKKCLLRTIIATNGSSWWTAKVFVMVVCVDIRLLLHVTFVNYKIFLKSLFSCLEIILKVIEIVLTENCNVL